MAIGHGEAPCGRPKAPNTPDGEMLALSGLDGYFLPLRLACESKLPRITEVALACIQKLIAYGYVQGKTMRIGKMERAMVDVVMETICACKDQEDELVQLQVVKAVLTAVTSTVCSCRSPNLRSLILSCGYNFVRAAPSCPSATGFCSPRDDSSIGSQNLLLHLSCLAHACDPDNSKRHVDANAQCRISAP